jgi:hypothetical protein
MSQYIQYEISQFIRNLVKYVQIMSNDKWHDIFVAPYAQTALSVAFCFMYLGLPIRANPRIVSTWDPVVKTIEMRLLS